MFRRKMIKKKIGSASSFRWRSHEIIRIEGFSDAVLAFAVTLLVVSLEVPKTFDQLSETMSGFVAFACAFAVLFLIWYNQYIFFRRYGLQDAITITLNGCLLFVVLFFVYPLKFLFSLLVRMFSGHGYAVHLHDGSVAPAIRVDQWPDLMIIYGLGYIAVYGIFALLYRHAGKKHVELDLNPLELFDTKASVRESFLNICIGMISISFVLIGGPNYAGWSGLTYALIGPVLALHRTWSGKRRRKLEVPANADIAVTKTA